MSDDDQGMQANAWAFLDISKPACAWSAYRGVLVPAPSEEGFVSVWASNLIRKGSSYWLSMELMLEEVRRRDFPARVSRLSGMYCFADRDSVDVAIATWPMAHFKKDNLVDLYCERRDEAAPLDANWITNSRSHVDPNWGSAYWSGEPFPHEPPAWEIVVGTRAFLLGTELRNRAFDIVKARFPDTLVLLETARMAAWIGSDLGNIATFGRAEGEDVVFEFVIDMRDAAKPDFIRALVELRDSGHPINYSEISPLLKHGGFVLPDLRPENFRLPRSSLPGLPLRG